MVNCLWTVHWADVELFRACKQDEHRKRPEDATMPFAERHFLGSGLFKQLKNGGQQTARSGYWRILFLPFKRLPFHVWPSLILGFFSLDAGQALSARIELAREFQRMCSNAFECAKSVPRRQKSIGRTFETIRIRNNSKPSNSIANDKRMKDGSLFDDQYMTSKTEVNHDKEQLSCLFSENGEERWNVSGGSFATILLREIEANRNCDRTAQGSTGLWFDCFATARPMVCVCSFGQSANVCDAGIRNARFSLSSNADPIRQVRASKCELRSKLEVEIRTKTSRLLHAKRWSSACGEHNLHSPRQIIISATWERDKW